MINQDFRRSIVPEEIEIRRIEHVNIRNNQVETTMRLRALAEISEMLDTESLLSLCESLANSVNGKPNYRV